MGFIPAIRRIVSRLPRSRQTLCFSATLEPSVQYLVDEYASGAVRLAFGSTTKASESVNLLAYEVHADQKLSLLKRLLNEETGRTLIFVRTKRATERLAEKLNRQGIPVSVLHGDRSQSQRNSALLPSSMGHHESWWPRTWLLAESTLTILPRSLITICRRYRKTLSIAWEGREGPELQAQPSRSFQESSGPIWPELSARCNSRCVVDTLIPVLSGKNGPCQWMFPACGRSRLSPDPGWFAFRERFFSAIRFNNCEGGGQSFPNSWFRVFGGIPAKTRCY